MNYSEWHQIATQAAIADIDQVNELSTQTLSITWQLMTSEGCYWAKSCLARHHALIDCELENIVALQQAGVLTQQLIGHGKTNKTAWLIAQWQSLDTTALATIETVRQSLDRLHKANSPQGAYGWSHPNYINGLIQFNQWVISWSSFFRSQRILPQMRQAKSTGLPHRLVDSIEFQLSHRYDDCFANYNPKPSLLHGNLYQSFPKVTQDQQLLFTNAACYYGDPEVDLAAVDLAYAVKQQAFTDCATAANRSPASEQRFLWYQLYYALVEFNQMTQHNFDLIESLANKINVNALNVC
jgi:fructosamine-3-kinase